MAYRDMTDAELAAAAAEITAEVQRRRAVSDFRPKLKHALLELTADIDPETLPADIKGAVKDLLRVLRNGATVKDTAPAR